jgi:transposase-like protein
MNNHDENIAKAEKALAEARAAKRTQMENIMVPCTACGQGNRVGNMLVRIHEHYVHPYGCTGGDYWTWGKDSDRSFVCQHCETTNRLFGHYNESSLYWIIKDFVKHEPVRGDRDGYAHDAKSVNCKF